ncbi:hypothetical protein BZA70DRAFT_172583 [Myxozyma melibiosi]|uniref:Uncharacterized protein n=1 Tax=Myxozyma melibiosi TaxID=54550 RepID=A0ABR1F5G0_9ASCO
MVGASSSKRAAQKVDESDSEEDVFVRLLLKEQKAANANPPPTKSRNAVVDAFIGKSKNQNGLKPNTAFLNRIVQDTNSHNHALLKKEALDAVAKLRDFNKANPIANDLSRSERAPITFEKAREFPQRAAAERSTPSAARISSDESRPGYISDESIPSSNESHERSRMDAHRSKRRKALKSEHESEHSEERSRSDRRRHHSTARLERPSDDGYDAQRNYVKFMTHDSDNSYNQ